MRFARPPQVPSLVVLMVLTTSCALFGGDPTTTTVPSTTSSTTTTIAFPERSTTTTAIGPGVDASVAEQLRDEIAALIDATETVRGLQFLQEPPLTIVSPGEYAGLLAAARNVELDDRGVAGFTPHLRLIGMLEEGQSLAGLLQSVETGATVGFYDPATTAMVLSAGSAELSVTDRVGLVHELVHALTDQYFAFADEHAALVREGRDDAARALEALFEGDATYFQFVYLQELEVTDRVEVASAVGAVAGAGVVDGPDWLLSDLAFPYEAGLGFVERLVSGGGIAAVDRTYLDPPVSTEHVLHPERYRIGEVVWPLPEIDVEVEGYELVHLGSLGEWGLRLLLSETLSPGMVTQTADGWGADAFVVLRGGEEVAFAYAYKADTEDDAVEVATALVAHARTTMGAGDGVEVDGGILFDEGGPWVFIDRIGDGLIFVAATDDAAGRALRPQLRVP
jgi:hypothetical protein